MVDHLGLLRKWTLIRADVDCQRSLARLGCVNLEALRDVGAAVVGFQAGTVSAYGVSIDVTIDRHLRGIKTKTTNGLDHHLIYITSSSSLRRVE